MCEFLEFEYKSESAACVRDHLSQARDYYGFTQSFFNGFTNFQSRESGRLSSFWRIFCGSCKETLMVSPIIRMAISATARLKRKKLVDVLIEMFLKRQSSLQTGSSLPKNNKITQIASIFYKRTTWLTKHRAHQSVTNVLKYFDIFVSNIKN